MLRECRFHWRLVRKLFMYFKYVIERWLPLWYAVVVEDSYRVYFLHSLSFILLLAVMHPGFSVCHWIWFYASLLAPKQVSALHNVTPDCIVMSRVPPSERFPQISELLRRKILSSLFPLGLPALGLLESSHNVTALCMHPACIQPDIQDSVGHTVIQTLRGSKWYSYKNMIFGVYLRTSFLQLMWWWWWWWRQWRWWWKYSIFITDYSAVLVMDSIIV